MFTWPTPQALARALRVNQTVKLVDLHGNNLGNEGVKALTERRWAGLTLHCILDTAHDTTKSSKFFDAQALADALRANKTITTVDLRRNKFGAAGVEARAVQQGHGWAHESSVPWCPIQYRFGISAHVAVCVHFTVLRADLSTHSADRPWPRPWKLMKPSQSKRQSRPGTVALGEVVPKWLHCCQARYTIIEHDTFESHLFTTDWELVMKIAATKVSRICTRCPKRVCFHPVFWGALDNIQRFCVRNEAVKLSSRHPLGGDDSKLCFLD